MRHFLLFFSLFQLASLRAQTFENTVNQAIPDDGSTVFFEILVSGLPDKIDTIFGLEQVCLNLTHTYVEDMLVKIEAPDGQIVVLFAGVGGGGDDFTGTCVAGTGLDFAQNAAPFSGVFQSYGVLGNVNRGQNPNGIWKLIIQDTYPAADEGFLIDWNLSFGSNPAFPLIFKSSNLPIVKFTTLGAPIANDPKVGVLMQIIDNGAGIRNFSNQTNYAYEGKIMTEWQGFSGTGFAKKSYDFESVDDLGNELDTTFLGFPTEHDWIFKAESTDPTLIKNTLSFEMARRMGSYAPRTRHCEMVLDGEYVGVYTLMEKIKRGKNRVNIAKLTASDTAGVDLTGGYIIEININGDPPDWISQYPPINSAVNPLDVEFEFVYPKVTKIKPQQAEYIKKYTDNFEDILIGNNFLDTAIGYRKLVDAATFIDFLIVNEFSMNYDSYARSTYLYKEKDTDGGLLKIGPTWDADRAYDFEIPVYRDVWVWEKTIDFWPFPFWWSRMWEDVSFRQQLACRWQNLRENTLKTTAFYGLIDSLEVGLDESQARNFQTWKDLGALTYSAHLDTLKSIIGNRLVWMDSTLAAERPLAIFTAQQNGGNNGFWSFEPTDINAQNVQWDFGDGSVSDLLKPTHQYLGGGNFDVKMTVKYGIDCSEAAQKTLNFIYVGSSESAESRVEISPNPFFDHIFIKNAPENAVYEIKNALGQLIFSGKNLEKQDFSTLPTGVYFLKINDRMSFRLLKN